MTGKRFFLSLTLILSSLVVLVLFFSICGKISCLQRSLKVDRGIRELALAAASVENTADGSQSALDPLTLYIPSIDGNNIPVKGHFDTAALYLNDGVFSYTISPSSFSARTQKDYCGVKTGDAFFRSGGSDIFFMEMSISGNKYIYNYRILKGFIPIQQAGAQ
jgi:hypothetical protein